MDIQDDANKSHLNTIVEEDESKDNSENSSENKTSPSSVFGTTIPNIINVIPNYNSSKTESTISLLKQELKEQKKVNEMLKSDNFEKKSTDILSFIERNENEINDQISRVTEVVSDLKSIISENENLQNNEDKYNDIIESEDCIRVAEKILKLKALKEDINFFLQESGIAIHLNH